MFDTKDYLEDIRYTINTNSPAQLKMFIFRHREDNPDLHMLLELNRFELKQYLQYLKNDVLPLIEEHLENLSDDPLH